MTEAAASAEAPAPKTLPRQTRAVPAALTSGVPRRARRTSLAVPLSVVLAVGAAGFFLWRAQTPVPHASTAPATVAVAAPRPELPPASAAAAVPAPTAEVSTVRKVWVRVTVDGQKVIERELPADARIPLTPTSQVVIRAGDAGAVRVAIAGKDQGPVGRDGEVATKSFTVAVAPPR